MPQEHIVATCLYILDRDEVIHKGDIEFQRAWSLEEYCLLAKNFGQQTDNFTKTITENGLRPLGRLTTAKGRMIVFPNTHVNKLSMMINSGEIKGKQRIVFFFIVDPEFKVVSSEEIPDQRIFISSELAQSQQLELMNERKLLKQDWNIQDLSYIF